MVDEKKIMEVTDQIRLLMETMLPDLRVKPGNCSINIEQHLTYIIEIYVDGDEECIIMKLNSRAIFVCKINDSKGYRDARIKQILEMNNLIGFKW